MSSVSKSLIGCAAYMAIAMAVLGYNDAQRFSLCDPLYEAGYLRGRCYETNAYKSVLAGLVWPVYVPLAFGAGLVKPDGRRPT